MAPVSDGGASGAGMVVAGASTAAIAASTGGAASTGASSGGSVGAGSAARASASTARNPGGGSAAFAAGACCDASTSRRSASSASSDAASGRSVTRGASPGEAWFRPTSTPTKNAIAAMPAVTVSMAPMWLFVIEICPLLLFMAPSRRRIVALGGALVPWAHHLDARVLDQRLAPGAHAVHDRIERAPQHLRVVADHGHRDQAADGLLEPAGLRDAHLVARGDPILHLREHAPLVLERARARNAELETQDPDPDRLVGRSEEATSFHDARRGGSLRDRGDFLDEVRLDLIADLDVVEVLESDAALVALLDLTGVVLEPTQRRQLAGPDHRAVAQEPRLGVPHDLAVDDHAAGDVSDLRDLEDLADLDPADDLFLVRGTEETDHRLPDVVEDLVDHLVVPDLDAELFCGLPRLDVRAHVVAHDDRVRRVSERDVALRHGADARVDDLQPRALDLDRLERLAERFERTVDVRLDHELELDETLFGLLRVQILERPALAALERSALHLLEPVLDERLCVAFRLHDHEVVARGGHLGDSDDLDRRGGRRGLDSIARVVRHVTDATPRLPEDHILAAVERAVVDEQRRDRATATFEPTLQDHTFRVPIGVRLVVADLRDEQDA